MCRNRKTSASRASSCAPTPCSSASATRTASSPVAAGSSRQSNCRPSSAAVCSTRRSSSLSAASRERTPSANDRGTPGAASDSSTRNGIPSAARWTRAMTSSGADGRQARTMAATWPAVSRPRARCWAARRPVTRATSSAPADGVSPRQVATQSTASADRLSLRYSTTASVSGSAQCRSSSTKSRPALPAKRRSSCSTASPRTGAAWSPRPSPSKPPIVGITARSAGSHGVRPGSSGNARSRSACSSASVSGRYGMLALVGTARPASTVAPHAIATIHGDCHRRQQRPAVDEDPPRVIDHVREQARQTCAALGCRERGPQPRGLRIAADEHGTQQVRH